MLIILLLRDKDIFHQLKAVLHTLNYILKRKHDMIFSIFVTQINKRICLIIFLEPWIIELFLTICIYERLNFDILCHFCSFFIV